jgi:PEP-CTERM motif
MMRRLIAAVLIALSSLVANVANAQSPVTLSVEDVVLQQQGSVINGFFDVFFDTIGPPPSMRAWNVRLNLSGPAGLTFVSPFVQNTDVGSPTRTPVAPTDASHPQNVSSTASVLQAAGLISTNPPPTLDDNDGLFRVPFQVAANVDGVWNVTIDTVASELSDPNANPISYIADNGTITVRPIPEPATLALFAIASVIGSVVAIRRRS